MPDSRFEFLLYEPLRPGENRLRCPACADDRKAYNQHNRTLQVRDESDRIIYHCWHCGEKDALRKASSHTKPYRASSAKDAFSSDPFKSRAKPVISPTPVHEVTVFRDESLSLNQACYEWLQDRGFSKATADHFKLRRVKFRGEDSVALPYFDAQDNLTGFKTRSIVIPKKEGAWSIQGKVQGLFGRHVFDPALGHATILEGEFDPLACYEAGLRNVLSIPHGAINPGTTADTSKLAFLAECEPMFRGLKRIVVAMDNDGPGKATSAEIARRVGLWRVYKPSYPEGAKDANDVLLQFGPGTLNSLISGAKAADIPGLTKPSAFRTDLKRFREGKVMQGYSTGYARLDSIFRMTPGVFTTMTGHPGCLDENARVLLADGRLVEIKNITAGQCILTHREGYIERDTVKAVWESGEKEVYELRTRRGRVIAATGDHRFYSFDGWKKLSDLQVGEFVATPDRYPTDPSSNPTIDEARFLAAWLAEGGKNNSSVQISNGSEAIRNGLFEIASRNGWRTALDGEFGIIVSAKVPFLNETHQKTHAAKMRHGGRVRHKLSGPELESYVADSIALRLEAPEEHPKTMLERFGVWGMKTDSIRIPEAIFSAHIDVVCEFVGWLFACDGSASEYQYEYTSKSVEFCRDLALLLERFGIHGFVSERTVKCGGKEFSSSRYVISDQPSRFEFSSLISVPGKQEKFLSNVGERGAYWHDVVPLGKSGRRTITRFRAAKEAYHKKDWGTWQKTARDIRWDEITSIIPIGVRMTFDLETEKNHNFFADGLLVHNSGKSELADALHVNMAMREGWNFGIWSREHPGYVQTAKLIEKFMRKRFHPDMNNVMSDRELEEGYELVEKHATFVTSDGGPDTMESILDRMTGAVMRDGIKSCVIDPYNYISKNSEIGREDLQISEMLTLGTDWAKNHECHIFFLAHPRTADEEKVPTGSSISGGSTFFAKSDFGLTVHRPGKGRLAEIHNWKTKYAWLGQVGVAELGYRVDEASYYDMDCPDADPWEVGKREYKSAEIVDFQVVNGGRSRYSEDDYEEDREL